MTAAVFVDANVIVYSRDRRDELKQRTAAEWMRQLWWEQRGRTSIQVLNEFYWIVTRKLKPQVAAEDAWRDVELLLGWKPQALDQVLIQRARRVEERYRVSWWDAMIVAAAQLQGCTLLLTEDLQHGAVFDGVQVCNPFLSQLQDAPASYQVELRSRHRSRGRPRKSVT
jgi:predicted nucleic acid-binding protein